MTLKEVFDEYFKKTKFDSTFAKNLYKYQIGYINSSKEYLDFFGGNLLGVHVIRFKDSDVIRLYDDVFNIDFYSLQESVKKVDTINHDFIISSDTLNLTLMYVIHRILTSPSINDKVRIKAAHDAGLIFFYRCIAALISDRFRYPVDPKLAQAVYANLSNKYLIKKLGTWHAVMDYRAKDLIDKNALHYKNLVKFNDDQTIVYTINDSQGRIRDLFKNYYNEFKIAHEGGEAIGSTSSTYLDVEGEETIKEKINTVENYVTYLKNIINDIHSFIKPDLLLIISKLNTNTSSRMIKQNLTWLSENYSNSKYHAEIDEFITNVIVHSLYLINNNMTIVNKRDYPNILLNIKNLYLSTRSVDIELIRIRDLGEKLIKESSDVKLSNSLIFSTRTSLILYITLRTLVGVNN